MKARVTWCLALGLAAVTTVAACSPGGKGQAQQTPGGNTSTGSSTTTANGSPSSAPKVATPLNATTFVNNPCSALASADVAGLRVTNPISKPSNTHPGCGWTGETGGSEGIDWNTDNTNGLSDLYAKSSTIAYWQPIRVDGYPAAYGDAIQDSRPQGDCVLNVAVNDHLYFSSSFNNPANPGPSCDMAKQAASDVLKNLKGSGGS